MVENVLITEAGGDPSAGYESKPTLDLVELMNTVDATVPSAVAAAAPAIAEAVDATAARLRAGGRLVYVGAGSSGRIAALDASECEATFSTPPGMVVALVAGGESAPALVQAAAEDDRDTGAADVEALVDRRYRRRRRDQRKRVDAVRARSARGRSARQVRSRRVSCATPQLEARRSIVAHEIAVVVGPEFLAGSTRLKAGTAQKLVLNTISTISMIRLGKTYGNLMVDVVAANEKLQERVRRIVAAASGASATDVDDAIADADGDARVAIVMLLARVDAQEARRRLDEFREKHRRRARGHVVRLGVEAALVDGTLVAGDVEILGGRVAGFGLASPNGRGIAVPGFVDLQVNGFAGVDFLTADTDGYRQAGEALLETGVTAYLPTFITSPEEQLLAALREVPAETDGPRVLGAHLEGPFLSALRLGIHPAAARCNPDLDLLERLLDAGPVRLVTLAPELPGASKVIERLSRREIAISGGHSDATAEQANIAFDLGVRSVTHLFNAMRPFHHRDPGIAGAALARPDVVVQLILDWVHVAPVTAAMVWQAAQGRVALVTDAMSGAGIADGAYRLGDLDVEVQ